MLDTSVLIVLSGDRQMRRSLARANRTGAVDIVCTHLQADEAGRTPGHQGTRLPRVLASVGARAVVTQGAAWDISRWEKAAWSDVPTAKKLLARSVKHIEDGLIAATAAKHGATLVTHENADHRRRLARDHSVTVWHDDDLKAWLAADAPDTW
jgi:predicted nucleic acid-binding protein